MTDLDPVEFQVVNSVISGIAQEMQSRMYRSAYSTIIRESMDASCAILDADGRLVGQHVILPLHMGAFPPAVEATLDAFDTAEMAPGDAFVTNHPYVAGTPHQSDMAVVSPAFHDGEVVGFCCNMAHKSDVGGIVPGSGSGQATDMYQEGVHYPPVRFYRRGEVVDDVERLIRENSRAPDLVLGDMHAQVGTNEIGRERVADLFSTYGEATMEAVFTEIFDSTERRLRTHVGEWDDGTAEAAGYLDDDGVNIGEPVRLHVEVTVEGEDVSFDFSGTQEQTVGPVNVLPPMVRACCYYALIAMTDPTIPNNHGLARAIKTTFGERTAVNPDPPAPVNSYIIPAQRLAEILLIALGEFTDERAVAESGGGGAIVLGGTQPSTGGTYSHYELFGSGYGARRRKDGVNCVSVHVGNSRITPIEVVESEFPVRITEFDLLTDSGGAGRYRGGLGFRRTYRLLEGTARFSKRDDRQDVAPRGLAGGDPGETGATVVNPDTDREAHLPSKFGDHRLEAGDAFRVDRAGGGGYGPPSDRPAERVVADVREGYVSPEAAEEAYGVALEATEDGGFVVDRERTRSLRADDDGGTK